MAYLRPAESRHRRKRRALGDIAADKISADQNRKASKKASTKKRTAKNKADDVDDADQDDS